MKILQVTNFFKPSWESGGPARVAYEISKRLVERGHEVTVYTTDGFKSRLNVGKNKPVYVDGIKTYYFKNLFLSTASTNLPIPYYMPHIIRKEIQSFDVVHIHEYRSITGSIAAYYAKKYSVPIIVQAHGSLPSSNGKNILKRIFDNIYGTKILKNSKCIALNNKEKEQYKNIGVDKEKIEIIPNGIDLSKFKDLPRNGEFRNKYSLMDKEKIILFLGRIHRIKGVDLLVQSFADLTRELDDVRLVIVGPDDGFLSSLKKQIADLKIDDKILFTGPLYERAKLEAYVDADVYVLPSRYETFPITVLESYACSTPVIVTDRCGISDVVQKVGSVIEYDKEQLLNAVLEVLSDEELGQRYASAGKKLVKNEFDWLVIINRIEKTYENAIDGEVLK